MSRSATLRFFVFPNLFGNVCTNSVVVEFEKIPVHGNEHEIYKNITKKISDNGASRLKPSQRFQISNFSNPKKFGL